MQKMRLRKSATLSNIRKFNKIIINTNLYNITKMNYAKI